ncbi:flavodoxin domain-containing protein [Dietzia kunjamensis]|nr:flavodoxin domain-containing protein [Dietzia kunjamensis]
MTSPVVAFTSRYGSTRRYATALGRRLGAPAVELADLAPHPTPAR